MPDGESRPLDWLISSPDYSPQILGTLVDASGVNIQLWQVADGQNTPVSVASSGCYQIGDTNRWGWSTENLSNDSLSQQQYFYLMTSSNNSENFSGQFFFALSEDSKWMHPNDRGTYLL